MQGEGCLWQWLQQAILEHEARPVPALLAWLEHEQHGSRQFAAPRTQQPRGSDQHGDVAVMTTRVHCAALLRGKCESGVLVHRQRIHVSPQQNGAARALTAQHRDDAVRGWTAPVLERQSGQRGHDFGGGLGRPQPQLRLAVNGAAQLHEVGQQSYGFLRPGRHGTSCCGANHCSCGSGAGQTKA